MRDKNKGFTLVNFLIVFGTIVTTILITLFAIKNTSLSRKISNSIYQHEAIYRFVVAYNFMCKTHPTNVLTFKTCTTGSSECKNGKIITPGTTKISCNSKSANASNAASYFVMHFNETGYVDYYNKKNLKSLDDNSSQCCSLKNSSPKRGKTNIYGDNKNNTITIVTNVGNKFSKDVYLSNAIDWPGMGFK
jgi:competence protein ComGC